jgi:hypothetical protein
MRLSNERLTTATGSATDALIGNELLEEGRPNQLAAMKIDKPKPVR